MTASLPKVSIGLPVYNGEEHLGEAIESLLGQSYGNIELVICDNGSTDSSEEICKDYAKKDKRLRYYRNKTNIGSHRNHNRTAELAEGDYFMWAGHDDTRSPDYVTRCIDILKNDDALVLCFTATSVVDQGGKQVDSDEALTDYDSESPSERFADLIRMDHLIEPIYGLIRITVLRKTKLFGQFADTDRVLLAELGLHGRFARISEPLIQRRDRTDGRRRSYPSRQQRTIWFEPSRPHMIVFPYCREFFEYLRAIRRAPITAKERRICFRLMLKWMRQHRRLLISDYVVVLKDLFRPLYYLLTGKSVAQARESRYEEYTQNE